MATALPLATSFTDASTTEAQLKTALTGQRAALAEIGDPMGRPGAIQNLSLAFSVGANALTCNVKTRAGAAPSATDPVSAALRNATLATGDFNVRNITAALSLVISSGSTLGHLNATAGFIYWYLIDNAGTLELAASTTYSGSKGIVTTVAEGGAGAADSATVMYSTTARTSVPFICIGRTTDTQTTAGTWTAVPTTVELAPLDALNAAVLSGTTILAGGQLQFPATQNASSDANTLDDYEEGTWTPSLGGTATYTNQIGHYTKIGREILIKCQLTVNAIGTGSTTVMSGLPFPSSTATSIATGAMYWSGAASALVYAAAKVTGGGATTISFPNQTAANATLGNAAMFTGSTDVTFGLVYT